MTEPMNPAEIAAMVADMQAGTKGPWKADGPVWNQIVWTDGENRLCFMAHSNGLNDDRDIANARRIARVPAMEQTILALSALSAMTAERDAAVARVKVLEAVAKEVADEAWGYEYLFETNFHAFVHDKLSSALAEGTPT